MRATTQLLATIFAATTVVCSMPVRSQAPMPKTQAPGFYRMMLGDFEVTALNDGVIPWPTKSLLPTATPEQIDKSLFAMGLVDPVGMSYNAFLVNTGTKLVLIDAGTGGKLDDSPAFHGAGRLLANLRAAGYQPEQIDEIFITHMGPDHIGGLTHDSTRTFPNATLHAARREVTAYLDSSTVQAGDSVWRRFRAGLFQPYMRAGRFEGFDHDTVLVPGIRAFATSGHTPGHTAYVVESRGQTLMVWGDLVHVGAIQFAYPSLPTTVDADVPGAIAQRQRILRLVAEKDCWVAGGHLSFPGIGHVRSENGHYQWSPINYTIPR